MVVTARGIDRVVTGEETGRSKMVDGGGPDQRVFAGEPIKRDVKPLARLTAPSFTKLFRGSGSRLYKPPHHSPAKCIR